MSIASKLRARIPLYTLLVAVYGFMFFRGPLVEYNYPLVWLRTAKPVQPTVVFLVLDTVRADRTSLCGHDRPTTPFLEELANKNGSSFTCSAYSPSSWTLPSHASFFTGLEVPEHGTHRHGGQIGDLPDKATTLAERFAKRGYQTVAISGNPGLQPDSGVMQGFDFVSTLKPVDWSVNVHLTRALGMNVDLDKPLFVFVNIADAHDPWEAVLAGLDWVPETQELGWELCADDCETRQFLTGAMSEDERTRYLTDLNNAYDYGVHLADNRTEEVLGTLERFGWLSNDYRMVITSDHGELLGEHDKIYHGHSLHEPVTRVPLIYHDTTQVVEMPEVGSALIAHDLLLDGMLTDLPIESYSYKDPVWMEYANQPNQPNWVSVWDGQTKATWRDGTAEQFDLRTDHGEQHSSPVTDARVEAKLQPAIYKLQQSLGQSVQPIGDSTVEALIALGYIE